MAQPQPYHPRSQQQALRRDLERALASEAALKAQHADMIRTVARSPTKVAPKPQQRPPRPAAAARESTRIAAYHPGGRQPRPQSPTASQDTVGREIDAAIAKSVANILQTPEPARGPRIVPIPAPGNSPLPLTPTFFTAKRRNMHCELDEPGAGVPFPRPLSARVRRGFWGRLLSCLVPPSPYSPPLGTGTPLPRPASAKIVSVLAEKCACFLYLQMPLRMKRKQGRD